MFFTKCSLWLWWGKCRSSFGRRVCCCRSIEFQNNRSSVDEIGTAAIICGADLSTVAASNAVTDNAVFMSIPAIQSYGRLAISHPGLRLLVEIYAVAFYCRLLKCSFIRRCCSFTWSKNHLHYHNMWNNYSILGLGIRECKTDHFFLAWRYGTLYDNN